MQKTNDKTTLQWLAPSMARDGLLKNGDWVLPAAVEAESLFGDPELQLPSQFLAVLNRFALDYIKQAPALVVAAAHGTNLLHRNDRLEVGRRFMAACESGMKLSALMQSYSLAPQLRALSGDVVRHDQNEVLVALSTMLPASALAQSIPKDTAEQRHWLQCLQRWRWHMGRHFRDRDLFLDWAAMNVRDARARASATDIADFAGRNRATFNLSWNFPQALAASQRWHTELAFRPSIADASRADWKTVIDYGPLPSLLEIDGFAFHALQTREALFEEGARMHHCVRIYSDKVVRGSSRIYSVRAGGQHIATLELVRITRAKAAVHRFRQAQLKGQRNSRPADAVWKATAAFLATCNRSAPGIDQEYERGERTCEELRVRLGDDVYEGWFRHMQCETFDGKVLTVSFPTRFLRKWVESHYRDTLLACCAGEFAGVERIEIGLRQPGIAARLAETLLALNVR